VVVPGINEGGGMRDEGYGWRDEEVTRNEHLVC